MDDLQRQHEVDMYRRRFEEAMIRIEDQEDIEAYNEAKAEIDDEFDEDELKAENAAIVQKATPKQEAEVKEKSATTNKEADEDP